MSVPPVKPSTTSEPENVKDANKLFVLAFDPGTTTGWASFLKPNDRDGYESGQIEDGCLPVWQFLDTMNALDPEFIPDVIVCESFQYRPKLDKAVLSPVEVIGVIKLWCHNNKVKLQFQTPGQRMWWDDNKLKRMQVYKPNKPHANDAMRHLLTYLNVLPPKT